MTHYILTRSLKAWALAVRKSLLPVGLSLLIREMGLSHTPASQLVYAIGNTYVPLLACNHAVG